MEKVDRKKQLDRWTIIAAEVAQHVLAFGPRKAEAVKIRQRWLDHR